MVHYTENGGNVEKSIPGCIRVGVCRSTGSMAHRNVSHGGGCLHSKEEFEETVGEDR